MTAANEERRLDALYQLNLLDTAPSESFDRITRMASRVFGLPIAAVSLTDRDRQWFKSRVGVQHVSIPRHKAPCSEVAETNGVLVIPDLLDDPCYATSGLAAAGTRFYAGAPLVTRDGYGLGALCVLGTEPRTTTALETEALSDLAAMVMAQIELQHAFGRIDPLSGLPNRTQFLDDLEDLGLDSRGQKRLAVLIDLGRTDQINNSIRVMGSSYMDDMVRQAVHAIRSAVPRSRKVYHVSATQFAFLADADASVDAYAARVEAVLRQIRAGSRIWFAMTTVVGVAPFIAGETAPGDVLRIAHSAADDARSSRTMVSVYSTCNDEAHLRRFTLFNDFADALSDSGQLRLVFQPRIDLVTRQCVGAEALLRWRHPKLGEISPGEFIPLVEHSSMARPMTNWVLEHALMQLEDWQAAGLDLQLSVNVSAADLDEPDFVQRVQLALLRHRILPGRLELEITETTAMDNSGFALQQLSALSNCGVRLAIDDFGTGYSSLSYLQQLPVHVVKIDRSFVTNIANDERNRNLVRSMVGLSRDLGYRVVAEGIETADAVDLLAGMACDEAQGYLFGRPMAAADFAAWIDARDGETRPDVRVA
jgi:EAL domain-containing protein (putative c-di-GMP-specific phosphodiesterase class I)/GGDEF domain-containing protein